MNDIIARFEGFVVRKRFCFFEMRKSSFLPVPVKYFMICKKSERCIFKNKTFLKYANMELNPILKIRKHCLHTVALALIIGLDEDRKTIFQKLFNISSKKFKLAVIVHLSFAREVNIQTYCGNISLREMECLEVVQFQVSLLCEKSMRFRDESRFYA